MIKKNILDIEIPSNSATLQSGISNRHSRIKSDTINGNVYKEENKNNEKENEKEVHHNLNGIKEQLEKANFLAEERLNHLKYLQADFDNYRKKFDKEKENIIKLANENLIKELIIILDDMESSIKLMENEKNKEGIFRLHKKFFNILQKHGLKHIEALGKKFNPEYHEVLAKELSEKEEDEIIEEIQRGYMLDFKVIRPAKVKISEHRKVEQTEHLNDIESFEKPQNSLRSPLKTLFINGKLEGYSKSSIEIPSNSVTLQSGISNRHSRTKGDTINGNVYKKENTQESLHQKDLKIGNMNT